MTSSVALLMLLTAAAPCEDVGAAAERLHAAARQGVLSHALAVTEAEEALGLPLSLQRSALTSEAGRSAAERRLRTACALEEQAARAPAGDRVKLLELLERPEFSHLRSDDSFWDSVRTWLQRTWHWLTGSRSAEGFTQVTRFLVLALALALLLAGASRLLPHLRRRPPPEAAARRSQAQRSLELAAPATHLSRARQQLHGEPRTALREGLLALLSGLERKRWARPDRVKTNRELAAELPRHGAPATQSVRVTELLGFYDRTFYSLHPVSAEAATRFLDEVSGLAAEWEAAP